MDTRDILHLLYRIPRRKLRRRSPKRWLFDQRDRFILWISKYNWHLVIISCALAVSASSHLYYYNLLITMEFNVKASWAQIEAVRQKRNHIQRNLKELLSYHAKYERSLFTDVTKMRTEEKSGGGLSNLLGQLRAVAEQYPINN